jgi:hypothetical protein
MCSNIPASPAYGVYISQLWEQLKSLGYSTEQKENAKIVLDIDKGHCHDSNVIANYINHFFTNVASITYLSPLEGYCFTAIYS